MFEILLKLYEEDILSYVELLITKWFLTKSRKKYIKELNSNREKQKKKISCEYAFQHLLERHSFKKLVRTFSVSI